MPKFAGGCCCGGCLYLADSFERTEDNISDDGVNLNTSTRWTFTDGDWLVDIPSGRLVAQTTGSPIYFYSGGARRFVITALFQLNTLGDYVTLLYGGLEMKIEAVQISSEYFLKVTCCGIEKRLPVFGFPYSTTLLFKITNSDDFDTNAIDGTLINFGAYDYMACALCTGSTAGYTTYGFKASENVWIDDVTVNKSTQECTTVPGRDCSQMCFPNDLPESITVEVSGLGEDCKGLCQEDGAMDDCLNAAFAAWTAASFPCYEAYTDPGNPDPDYEAFIACLCEVDTAYNLAQQTCWTSNVMERVKYPWSDFTSFVLDKDESLFATTAEAKLYGCPSCNYRGEFPISYYPSVLNNISLPVAPGVLPDCGEPYDDNIVITASLAIVYYDSVTNEWKASGTVNIVNPNYPVSWSTAITEDPPGTFSGGISLSDICSGTDLLLANDDCPDPEYSDTSCAYYGGIDFTVPDGPSHAAEYPEGYCDLDGATYHYDFSLPPQCINVSAET